MNEQKVLRRMAELGIADFETLADVERQQLHSTPKGALTRCSRFIFIRSDSRRKKANRRRM